MWKIVRTRQFQASLASISALYTFHTLQTPEESWVGTRLQAQATTSQRKIDKFPTRQEMLLSLQGRDAKTGIPVENPEFDLLIVGGGATGVGCAVDAASRGLKVALVERNDFSCGTSSKSTKLVHGGIRYLEKAFLEMDIDQYNLVKEALHERGVFLKIAPYLSKEVPIMLPIYQFWKIPYYWAGSIAYDILAGKNSLSHSYYLTKKKALQAFPTLRKDDLKGGIVYYDGMHNDSRMNVVLGLTAIEQGATLANHVEVVELLKRKRTRPGTKEAVRGDEELYGARVRDSLTGESWIIKAKGFINATGPFTDGLRRLDGGEQTSQIVAPSAGVHIVLPKYFCPDDLGLVDPNTSDGRVVFILPWQGSVVAGTTDSPSPVTADPLPSEKDITWILKEVQRYLSPDIAVRREDVLAAWSGIRPLVRDPSAKSTAALVRNHMVHVSPTGLLTIAGGKWTTYRAMAKDAIDEAIKEFDLNPTGPCVTETLPLVGSHHWSRNLSITLAQKFGLEIEVARHLSESYGDRSWAVASLASLAGSRWPLGRRLVPGYPYIEAEVRYACQNEYACTATDVLGRRLRLAFLNAELAMECLPRVIDIMASELDWTADRKASEYKDAVLYLQTMGLNTD